MKKVLVLVAAMVMTVSTSACSSADSQATPANANKVLLVRAKEGGGENLIIDHLKKKGYTVYDVVDANLSMEQAKNYGVIYVSSAASSTKIDTRLKQSPVPLVVSKTQTASNIGMMGITDYGEEAGVKTSQIVDGKHPLAAGLKGTVAIYKEDGKISYSPSPSKEATVILEYPADGNKKKATIFAYEKGAKNVSGETVPARQVFFSLPAGQAPNLTDDGWKLFDAAIQWAAQNGTK